MQICWNESKKEMYFQAKKPVQFEKNTYNPYNLWVIKKT